MHASSADPIETAGLGKRYGTTVALSDLNLRVRAGEVYGFLGPNGAGKTTTIRLLLGLHRATTGTARIFGYDAWREPVPAHRHVAYVPGEPALWPALTGAETLRLLGRLHGAVDVSYRRKLVRRFELDADRPVRALSKGNRQKVALIAALATRADLLLLDEPTAGLDPLMESVFRDCVADACERGQTVLLSSHILSEVEALADRVGILRAGRLIDEGTLAALRHLRTQTVEVNFATLGVELPVLDEVRTTATGPRTARFEVSGPIGPLLGALGDLPVTDLQTHAPSLEEIFVSHYREAAA